MWRYLVISAAISGSACADLQPPPTSPSASVDALSQQIGTPHYVFHFASGDGVDAVAQEAFHDWIAPRLGIEPPRPIEYRKYRDREHMGALEGIRNTNGIANPETMTLFTIYPFDTHEATHLYVSTWAKHSVALLSEGLAMAHTVDPRQNNGVALWNNTPLDTIVRTLSASNQRPSLADLAATASFRQFPDSVTYPVRVHSSVFFSTRTESMRCVSSTPELLPRAAPPSCGPTSRGSTASRSARSNSIGSGRLA